LAKNSDPEVVGAVLQQQTEAAARQNTVIETLIAERDSFQADRDRIVADVRQQIETMARQNQTIETLIAERESFRADRDRIATALQQQRKAATRQNQTIETLIAERDSFQADRDRIVADVRQQIETMARQNQTIETLIAERESFRADRDRIAAALQQQRKAAARQNRTIEKLIAERDAFQADRDRSNAYNEQIRSDPSLVIAPNSLAPLIERLYPSMNYEDRVALVGAFARTAAPYMHANGSFYSAGYESAEKAGMHLLPVHFYSPLATRDEVVARSGKKLVARGTTLGFDLDAQIEFFDRHIAPFLSELADVPFETPYTAGDFFWANQMYAPQDAAVYYGMIRSFNPSQIIEVGSGYSTLVAVKAAQIRDDPTSITCVEPFPTQFFNKHLRTEKGINLVEKPVQEIKIEQFRRLGKNDILFIDSSHVVKPGSDVEYILYRILPILKSGVIVHIHDIFLPRGYRDSFYLVDKRHWNENYIVGAFLMGNNEWEVLIANAFAAEFGQGDILRKLAVGIGGKKRKLQAQIRKIAGGGSIWIRRS
jgi:methyltransferase family protein